MPRNRPADVDEPEEATTPPQDVDEEPRDDPAPEIPTTENLEEMDSEPELVDEPVRDRRVPLKPERRRARLIGPCNVYRHLHDPDREHAILKARTDSDARYAAHEDWEFVEQVDRTPADYELEDQ